MRFLCLHGMGTNSRIFELQTAQIRHRFGSSHDFVFVDGSVPWTPAPGVKDISSPEECFYRYIIEGDIATFRDVYSDLQAFVVEEGPFDGILGFSEGGGLAASLIVEQLRNPNTVFTFKCGVFFSAGGAVDLIALRQGRLRELDPFIDGKLLNIPTAHIWDMQDDVHPGFGAVIRELCKDSVVEEVRHDFRHEIPGRGASDTVSKCIKAIDRTVERASVV